MTGLFKKAIDRAVSERDIAWLTDLIRRADTLAPEIREHLAAVIGGLLAKKINFPNRKPKQGLGEKRQALAARIWEVKKTKGWKLRSVVDSVAKESRCSTSTVWSAWSEYGPVIAATALLREKYDIDALVDAFMTAARGGKKLSKEEMSVINELQRILHGVTQQKAGRCKQVRTNL